MTTLNLLRDTNDTSFTDDLYTKHDGFEILYSPTVIQPPKLSYLYNPCQSEEIDYNLENKFKSTRFIFEGVKLNDFESQMLKELKEYILLKNSPFEFSESYLHRFLQANEYNIRKTFDSLFDNYIFRQLLMPKGFNILYNKQTIEILNLGSMYISGRDNRFRPNIVIKLKLFKNKFKKYTINEWTDAIIFLLEYCIKYMLIPGKVESWNIILDIKDFGLYNLSQEMKDFCVFFQNHYKCRLNRLYFINMSTVANVMYRLIPTLLGSYIEKKLVIINDPNDLFKNIHRSQIEKFYGGDAILDSYFPPVEVSGEYFVDSDTPDTLLSTDDVVVKKKYKSLRSEICTNTMSTFYQSQRSTCLIYHQPVKQIHDIKLESEMKSVGPVCDPEIKCIIM
jgi:hypothetical protein